MEIFIIIFLVIITGLLVWNILKSIKPRNDGEGLTMILQQMNELQRVVDSKIGESAKEMHETVRHQVSESVKAIRDVTEKLTKLDETNKQVMGFAEQLQSLQDMLKNPKQRGVLGEYYLETVLKNVLPPGGYQMQYPFKNGDIVDAVVFVKEKIVPIDSKFSLENYTRLLETHEKGEREQFERAFKQDLKNRIEETSKYIRPEENTMDFAFMFIPHEAIYYDLLVAEIGGIKIQTQDLIEYAFKRHVLIVSPTSFLAFLQTVLQGLRSLQIEESAKEIQMRVGELAKHLSAYEDYHQKLGKNLQTVVNQYGQSSKEFKKIDKDILRITGDEVGFKPLEIEGGEE